MKVLIHLLIYIPLFLCCKESKENTSIINSKLQAHGKIVTTNIQDNIPMCGNEKQDFTLYTKLSANEKINVLDKLGSKFYYAVSKENFNNLFNRKNMKCVAAASSKTYSYFTIYYDETQNSKEIYVKIKGLERNNENLNKYYDFFKRGLVFIVDSEENKITLISFNIFADNSLPEKVEKFFLANKTDFEKVFMTTGIGAVQDLVE